MSEQTLRRKLFLARKAAEAVAKSGHNHEDDFKYAKAQDVLAEANRVLEKQGIVVIPSVEEVEFKIGKSGILARAEMTFEVCDSKTCESLTKKWAGTGFDKPGDKALYAAITGGTKYFYASLLGIPFGTDPEDDGGLPAPGPSETRERQDREAERPDPPSPEPVSDLPVDWDGLERQAAGAPLGSFGSGEDSPAESGGYR